MPILNLSLGRDGRMSIENLVRCVWYEWDVICETNRLPLEAVKHGVADQSSPIAILWGGATNDARLQTSSFLELVSKRCTPYVSGQYRYKTLALTAAMKDSARIDTMEHL